MSLAADFARCEASYLSPDDPEDPLDGVDFPRERKPWKRDRFKVRWDMQAAINRRAWANLGDDDRTKDHATGWWFWERTKFEVRRELFNGRHPHIDHRHPDVRREVIERLKRLIRSNRRYDNSPLPGFAP